MRMTRALVGRILATLVAAALAAGCTSGNGTDGSATVQTELHSQLEAFAADGSQGDTLALAELTDFAWTEVYRFPEGFTVDDMEKMIGDTPTFGQESSSLMSVSGWSALVFVNDGSVVETMVVASPLFLAADGAGPYPADGAVVEITTPDPGPSQHLKLRSAG